MLVYRLTIPVYRGLDGTQHDPATWQEFTKQLADIAGGYTELPRVSGCWRDAIGNPIWDESRQFEIGVDPIDSERIDGLAEWAADTFDQECVYVQQIGTARLVYRNGGSPQN